MPLPGVPQTFGLENCRDVLRKLKWEIEGLRTEATDTPDPLMFRAFNAAVTTWHLTDWVWEGATDAQHAAIPAVSKVDLQNFARQQCRAIHLCRQVATASKHVHVTMYPDPKVDAAASARSQMPENTSEVIIHAPPIWTVKFIDGQDRLPAIDVFEKALTWWTQFIYGRGIAA